MSGFTLTWLAFGLMLALFGARAWVVESSRGRLTSGGAAERGMTAAVAASVVLLVIMATANGGLELLDLLANGDANTATPTDVGPVAPGGAPAAVDPLAPAPVPGAPAPVPGAPAAPAAPANP